jgi:hypothetical protein
VDEKRIKAFQMQTLTKALSALRLAWIALFSLSMALLVTAASEGITEGRRMGC